MGSQGGALFFPGRNSRDFQKEAKSEVRQKDHTVRGMAGGLCSSRVRDMWQDQGIREKSILSFPKTQSASLWLKHVLQGGACLKGSL